jgi:hypothetical protein
MMSQAITAIIAALLTFAAQEIRQRIKKKKDFSTMPPPPTVEDCKKCFFFREFKKRESLTNSDTQIIRIYRHERGDDETTRRFGKNRF